MPPIGQIVFKVPRLNACDSTNRTAGPGVRQSAVSTTKNALQTCQVMPHSHSRNRHGLGTGGLGAQLQNRLTNPFGVAVGRVDLGAVRKVDSRNEYLGRRGDLRIGVEDKNEGGRGRSEE